MVVEYTSISPSRVGSSLLASEVGEKCERRFVPEKDEWCLLNVLDVSRRCEEVPRQFLWTPIMYFNTNDFLGETLTSWIFELEKKTVAELLMMI